MWCSTCNTEREDGNFCFQCGEKFQPELSRSIKEMAKNGEEEDLVMIKSLKYSDMVYDEDTSSNSDDSSISILSNADQPGFYENGPPFLATVCHSDGPPLEQREDIVKTKAIPARLKTTLKFNDESKLLEIVEQLKACENIDRDMEIEIANIKSLESNTVVEDTQLLQAANVAGGRLSEAREVAKKGQTTLKRAMEVIEVALPPFVLSCEKSYEVNDLSVEVQNEIQQYEQCLLEKRRAVLNFKLGQQKSLQAYQHLDKCIELAEADVKKISEKKELEESKSRMKNFASSKKEMDDIINGELDEVHSSLRDCREDLDNINIIQDEQEKRYNSACKIYDECERTLDMKINMNQQNQEDLRLKLSTLEEEEKKLIKGLKFQQQVQERATVWNENVFEQLTKLQTSITSVQLCTTTSLKVMELLKDGAGRLFSASLTAEQQYIDHLQDLYIEAKTRWRNALATSAVEKKLNIDNASSNVADYEEKYKQLKFDLKKAVQMEKRLESERLKKEMKEHKAEIKTEEKKKKQAERTLTPLLETISVCDEELQKLDRAVDSVDKLYEWRKQEIAANASDDLGSMDFSGREDTEDEDDGDE